MLGVRFTGQHASEFASEGLLLSDIACSPKYCVLLALLHRVLAVVLPRNRAYTSQARRIAEPITAKAVMLKHTLLVYIIELGRWCETRAL